MKRIMIYCFIGFMLGMSACSFLMLAISHSSMTYGALAILTIVAAVLNLFEVPAESNKKR